MAFWQANILELCIYFDATFVPIYLHILLKINLSIQQINVSYDNLQFLLRVSLPPSFIFAIYSMQRQLEIFSQFSLYIYFYNFNWIFIQRECALENYDAMNMYSRYGRNSIIVPRTNEH